MGLLEDMLKALDRVEVWKELQAAPKRISELESRVAELEGKLGGKWPADVCKYCGERAVRMYQKMGPIEGGKMRETWKCDKCSKHDTRLL
jgi:uncharacterized protein with PIN domain